MTRAGLAASFLALLLVPVGARPRGQAPAPSSFVVYVSAVDDKDVPIGGLAQADFIVKEDGKAREVTRVEPATGPLQVAVLVDDNGTGIFRFGLSKFAERLQGHGDLSLRVVTGQVSRIVSPTEDIQEWMTGIQTLGPRPGTPEGGQLLEGIADAAKELARREAHRPVIVALTVGGEEQSPLLARHVLDQLHASRASLYVIFVDNPAVRPSSQASRPADLLEGNMNLSQVIGDGPKQSGGRRRDVLATQALLTEVQQIARELTAQYAVTYLRPASDRAPQKIAITTVRRGVKVIAPTRAPIGRR